MHMFLRAVVAVLPCNFPSNLGPKTNTEKDDIKVLDVCFYYNSDLI